MDQDLSLSMEASERSQADSPLAVSSRRRALDRLRAAVNEDQAAHPILITGEPGAGKTWLAIRADPVPARLLDVDHGRRHGPMTASTSCS